VTRLTVNPVAAHGIIAPATNNGSNNAMRAVVVVALTAGSATFKRARLTVRKSRRCMARRLFNSRKGASNHRKHCIKSNKP
jgi:hypothetical protein